MKIVTPDFVAAMICNGPLTQAQVRVRDGATRPKNKATWDEITSWSLICEEILDTEHDDDWYDAILAELTRRGLDHEQINRMRAFAWQTAGWLNYDMMLWEWCALDENDIRLALGFQLERGIISLVEHFERMSYLDNPSRIPALVAR